jgi:hypothetical protein
LIGYFMAFIQDFQMSHLVRSVFAPAIAICSMFLVTGCALPPVIAAAGYASTGISYLASGKGPSDHALSAMTEKDCAIHRMAAGGDICRAQGDQPADGAVIASIDVSQPLLTQPLLKGVPLEGLALGTEIFAMIQNDGALEIFAHDPALLGSPENMQLILTIDGYRKDWASLKGVTLGGTFYAINDILV